MKLLEELGQSRSRTKDVEEQIVSCSSRIEKQRSEIGDLNEHLEEEVSVLQTTKVRLASLEAELADEKKEHQVKDAKHAEKARARSELLKFEREEVEAFIVDSYTLREGIEDRMAHMVEQRQQCTGRRASDADRIAAVSSRLDKERGELSDIELTLNAIEAEYDDACTDSYRHRADLHSGQTALRRVSLKLSAL